MTPNYYLGITAETEADARAEAIATNNEIGNLVHREPPTEEGIEHSVWVFEVFDPAFPEFLPIPCDGLHDMFDLPNLPNLPYFDIGDTFS